MKFGLTYTYENIFSEKAPSFNNLISDIPTKELILLISLMNAELFSNASKLEIQIRLLNFLTRRFDQQDRYKIISKYQNDCEQNPDKALFFFSLNLNLEFLHLALQAPISNENRSGTTPEQEYRIFKALLVVNSLTFDKDRINSKTDNSIDFFRKNSWPILIDQIPINSNRQPFTEAIKAKCFFDSLEFESNYAEYSKYFTTRFNNSSSLEYILRLAKAINLSKTDENNFTPFYINTNDLSAKTFDEISLQIEELSKSSIKNNHIKFRIKPIYKLRDNVYVVIHWGFLINKIFHGMIFDFYYHSGIREEFKSFISFKNYISKRVIEESLFKKIISGCFSQKHVVKIFDEGKKKNMPDAYVRKGKKIFLFEIKDTLLPSEVIDSKDFEKIKCEIDKKFNSNEKKKKGTFQIANQVKHLIDNNYEEELSVPKRNTIIIYPIIVYTDPNYDIPGFGLYLQDNFEKIVSEEIFKHKFRRIMKLSFININFFIENFDLLRRKQSSLEKIIEYSNNEIIRRKKRHSRNSDVKSLFELNENFADLVSGLLINLESEETNIHSLIKSLDIDRGLKK